MPRSEAESMVRTCGCWSAGEDVDHAVDRLARVVGVQRAEDEHAGFRRGERQRDGFQVAHFADEHDVGILAHGGLQARRGTLGVSSPHLALGDDAQLVLVHELDRLLDRDDVPRKLLLM